MEDQGGQQVACHPAAGGGDVQQPDPGGSQVGGGGGRQDGVEGEHRGGEAPGERVDGGEQEPSGWPVLWCSMLSRIKYNSNESGETS